MAAAGRPGAEQGSRLHRRGDRGAGRLHRLARPRPGHPHRRDDRPRQGRRRHRRWTLLRQLHGLPQLRRHGRRAPARRPRARTCSTPATSTSTRPCSPVPVRCRSSPTRCSRRRTSATSSPTSTSLKDQPKYGGSDLGSKGPVSEGLWGWLLRHRSPRPRSRLDRQQRRTSGEEVANERRQAARPRAARSGTTTTTSSRPMRPSRSPTLVCTSTSLGRPTSTRQLANRVERQISADVPRGRRAVDRCSASPTSPSTRSPGEAETFMGYSLSNLTLGL